MSEQDRDPDVILWGDSHGATLVGALRAATDSLGLNLYVAAGGGCPPVTGIASTTGDFPDCPGFNQRTHDYVVHSKADIVILSAHWALYTEGARFRNEFGARDAGGDVPYDVVGAGTDEDRVERLADAYREQVRRLIADGLKVIVVYQIPVPGWDVPYRILELKTADLLHETEGFDRESYRRWSARANGAFDGVTDAGVAKLKPADVFCRHAGGTSCMFYDSGEILYFDSNHLSVEGAKRFEEPFRQALSSLMAARRSAGADD
jgi:hypothetical protein